MGTRVKYSLCGLYGRIPGYTMTEMSQEMIKKKKKLCQEVLEILNVLEPGKTKSRGVILYELHLPTIMLAQNNFKVEEATAKGDFKKGLRFLKESLDILKDEPRNTLEGKIYEGAIVSLP